MKSVHSHFRQQFQPTCRLSPVDCVGAFSSNLASSCVAIDFTLLLLFAAAAESIFLSARAVATEGLSSRLTLCSSSWDVGEQEWKDLDKYIHKAICCKSIDPVSYGLTSSDCPVWLVFRLFPSTSSSFSFLSYVRFERKRWMLRLQQTSKLTSGEKWDMFTN